MTTNMRAFAVVSLLTAWAAVVGLLVSPVLGDMGGDSAQYLALAEAIARGDGYVDTHLPDMPRHVHYPPGMALVFAPLVWIFGPFPFVPAKLLVLAFGVFGLFCFARYFARLAGPQNAVLAIGLSAFSPYFVRFGHTLLSEIPAMAMLGATLLALDRVFEARASSGAGRGTGIEAHRRASYRWSWIAVAFAVFGFAFRVAGVAALAVTAVVLFVRWKRRAIPMLLTCALPVVLFFVWSKSSVGGTWSYGDEIAARIGGPMDLVVHALAGVPIYLRGIGTGIVETSFVATSSALSYGLAAFVVLGLALSLRGRRAAAAWCVILGVGIACAAPERTMRYLVPLAPLLAFFFLVGCRELFTALAARSQALRYHESRLARAGVAVAAVLALTQLPAITREIDRRHSAIAIDAPLAHRDRVAAFDPGHWSETRVRAQGSGLLPRYAAFVQLCELASTTTPADAILISRKPRLVSYLSGRRCVRLPSGGHAHGPIAARLARSPHDVFVDDGLFQDTIDATRVIDSMRPARYDLAAQIRGARLLVRRKAPSRGAIGDPSARPGGGR